VRQRTDEISMEIFDSGLWNISAELERLGTFQIGCEPNPRRSNPMYKSY
jgi:hypothetical protein